MVVLLVILILVFGFLLWILVAPFNLTIDTINHDYGISVPGVFGLRIIPDEEQVIIARITVLVIPIRLGLVKTFKWARRRQKRKKEKKQHRIERDKLREPKKARKSAKAGRTSFRKMTPRKMLKMLRSFEVKVLYLNLDTGDGMWNGLLTPLFIAASRGNKKLNINYYDEFALRLVIRNRLIRVIYAWISK
jgi:hypothetical protein